MVDVTETVIRNPSYQIKWAGQVPVRWCINWECRKNDGKMVNHWTRVRGSVAAQSRGRGYGWSAVGGTGAQSGVRGFARLAEGFLPRWHSGGIAASLGGNTKRSPSASQWEQSYISTIVLVCMQHKN